MKIPQCRWPRFGLRAFFIVVAAISILLGSYVVRVREQRVAVAAIRNWGGQVRFSYELSDRERLDRSVLMMRAASTQASPPVFADPLPPGPEWLREILGDDFFSSVVVVESKTLERVDLQTLKPLKGIKRLTFFGARIVDDDLQHLKHLGNLEILHLSATKITDCGIHHLLALPKLKILSLNYTAVADEGVRQLLTAPALEHLEINNTNVTDATLANLRNLPSLKSLGIRHTQVTAEALKEFQRAMPNCRLVR